MLTHSLAHSHDLFSGHIVRFALSLSLFFIMFCRSVHRIHSSGEAAIVTTMMAMVAAKTINELCKKTFISM